MLGRKKTTNGLSQLLLPSPNRNKQHQLLLSTLQSILNLKPPCSRSKHHWQKIMGYQCPKNWFGTHYLFCICIEEERTLDTDRGGRDTWGFKIWILISAVLIQFWYLIHSYNIIIMTIKRVLYIHTYWIKILSQPIQDKYKNKSTFYAGLIKPFPIKQALISNLSSPYFYMFFPS